MNIKDILIELHQDPNIVAPAKPKWNGANKFYWWRRFPIHKTLHKYSPLEEQIDNGDFDYTPYAKHIKYEYYWMAEEILALRKQNFKPDLLREKEDEIKSSYFKRLKHLNEDMMKDEFGRMEHFKNILRTHKGGTKDDVNEFIETYEGTLHETLVDYPKWLNQRK
jgi:hypothetical protein